MSNPAELPASSHLQRPVESVWSSMFLVIGCTMVVVARWAIAVAVARLGVTAKRLCY